MSPPGWCHPGRSEPPPSDATVFRVVMVACLKSLQSNCLPSWLYSVHTPVCKLSYRLPRLSWCVTFYTCIHVNLRRLITTTTTFSSHLPPAFSSCLFFILLACILPCRNKRILIDCLIDFLLLLTHHHRQWLSAGGGGGLWGGFFTGKMFRRNVRE